MISLSEFELNERPCFLFVDAKEQVINVPTKYASYLNSNLLVSPNSIPKYCQNLRFFLTFLKNSNSYSKLNINDLCLGATVSDVGGYLLQLKNRKKSEATVNTHDRCLKYFFGWLYSVQSGFSLGANINPYQDGRLKSPKPYKQSIKFMTAQEVIHFMLSAFKDERMRMLIHFMYDTGCRVSEAMRVLKKDLPDINDQPDSVYFLMLIHGSKKKGGAPRDRYTIISRVVVDRMNRYFNNYIKPFKKFNEIPDSNFFLTAKGNPLKGKVLTDLFYQKSKLLIDQGIIVKRYTPHMLRHGAALSILASDFGKDRIDRLLLIKNVFGHAQLKSTEMYTNIPLDAIRNIKSHSLRENMLSRYDEALKILEKTFIREEL